MGNLITKAYNKFQYEISKKLSDPEADSFAKQQEKQAIQDKATAERKQLEDINKSKENQEKEEKKRNALELEVRSKFSPLSEQIYNILNATTKYTILFIVLGLILYGGKISANQAIGYNIPFRIFSFFYVNKRTQNN